MISYKEDCVYKHNSTMGTSFFRDMVINQLNHPNIVKCLGTGVRGKSGEKIVLKMERLKRGFGNIPAKTAFKQLASGLAYIHFNNIIHGDIKPDNLMHDGSNIKYIDFGISVINRVTSSPEYYTLGYRAPEVSDGSVSFSADIWALGCVFSEILTRQQLFDDDALSLNSDEYIQNLSRDRLVGKYTKYYLLVKSMLAADYRVRPTAYELVTKFTKLPRYVTIYTDPYPLDNAKFRSSRDISFIRNIENIDIAILSIQYMDICGQRGVVIDKGIINSCISIAYKVLYTAPKEGDVVTDYEVECLIFEALNYIFYYRTLRSDALNHDKIFRKLSTDFVYRYNTDQLHIH